MEEKVYPESEQINRIVRSASWSLYDTMEYKAIKEGRKPKALTWEQLEENGAAEEFIIGHNYIFAPIPQSGQSLRQEYSITKGFGPSMLIEDHNEARWDPIYFTSGRYQKRLPILFTRLDFPDKFLGFMSPHTWFMPNPDMFGVPYPFAIDTLEKFFRIIKPEEEGLTTPIPMPRIPAEFN